MKLINRKVHAPLCGLVPSHLGTPTAVHPCMGGLTRRSQCDFSTGWPDRGRLVVLLVCLIVATGVAGLYGVPMASAQNFGTVALNSSSSATPVTVTFATGGTLNSILVSTQGISGMDFTKSVGGTCTVSTVYTAAQSCTVYVTFSPTAPGLRLGAVEVFNSSDTLLGTGYIYGTGKGSLLRYNPGTQAVLYSSLSSPQAMVVDAGKNVYIADTGNHRALKLPWNGASYGTPVTVGTGWSAPSGVAVDGAGNLYVADAGSNLVVEVPWTGSAYGAQVTISGIYNFAQDLTIDGTGNLYILTSAATITKLPWSGTEYGAQTAIGSGLSGGKYNTDVVDSSGNIYIADYNNGNIVKETLSGGSYTQTILGSFGGGSVDGVATDPAGNVYVANYGANTVLMLPWTGTGSTGYSAPITLTSNGLLSGPEAVYLDGIGNIYIEAFNNNRLEKWSVTDLPTLTFSTATDVGSPDATDNPQTVSLLNIGNNALTIAVPATGDNPSIASGFSYASSSTCPQLSAISVAATLAPGATCTYAVDFAPTEAGANTGSLVLTDDYLGASSTTQSIGLSGTGISLVTKLAFAVAPATPIALGENAGSAVVHELTSSNAIDTAAADLITLTVSGPGGYSQTYTATAVSGVGTFDLSGVALNTSGVYTYTASLASVTSAIASETVNNITSQAISFSPSTPVSYGVAPITLSATGGASGNPVTFSHVSGPGILSGTNNTLLTVTGAGTIVIAANQAGNTNYSAATQVTANILVFKATLTVLVNPVSSVYGVAFPAFSGTLSGVVAGDGITATYSTTATPTSPVGGSYSIVATLHDPNTKLGNYSVTNTPAALSITAEAPTLIFGSIPAQTYGNAPFAVSATSASSGAVTYTVVSGPATIVGNIVTLTGAGTVMLSASQAASGNYAAATVTTSFTVAAAAGATVPTLSFAPIAAQTFGNAPFAVSATSASSGVVTYTVVSGPATIAVNMVTLTGAGTVVLSASQAASGNYAAATATTSFTVAASSGTPIVPTLSFAPIAAQTYGNVPFAVSATSASSGAVTYTVVTGPATIAVNLVTLTGAGTVMLSASQAAGGNYAAATATTSFTVAAAPVGPVGFTLTTSSGAESVLPGGAAAFNLTLAPGSGSTYPDALTLSATGLPAGATVAFSPATIAAGSGATPVTMTVQTIKPQTARDAKPGGSLGTMALALLLLPMAGIKRVRRRLRKMPGLPVVLAAAALSLGAMVCLTGCGSSGGFFNQAPTQYTVAVTATDTVTGAHTSTSVTLNVQ
jgi:sugar lactone lactonase YvrE